MLTCPNCGISPLAHAIRDMQYTYKGRSTTIPDLVVEHCAGCKEVLFAQGEQEHYGALIAAFRQQVDAQERKQVSALRKALGLTRDRADALFGDVPGDFARFEKGEAPAPAALLKLLRLLGKHPALLDEL
ncbi:type II toxin-antitoxin system MqsA family antitoxin [Massilia oculi]|uniref:Type II toxin-antitoxin system MqsA family antitoxin n=1 Tax=Massilia hydrophila TaxID=3044279 RepID=A0ABS7YDF2_9BURK|nr:type II TA system antitoxin MqsA family protein [Massilia oculi]MCA1856385.1 type II toxin-antitoxin system MqsA family antitoxin [Massilia oculi]